MREFTHDTLVHFRANGVLVAMAERHARERSMSLSELMRHAVRNEVLPDREGVEA